MIYYPYHSLIIEFYSERKYKYLLSIKVLPGFCHPNKQQEPMNVANRKLAKSDWSSSHQNRTNETSRDEPNYYWLLLVSLCARVRPNERFVRFAQVALG
jgi:hypothetical protein